MAQQTITLSTFEGHTLPDVHFDIRDGKNFAEYLDRIFGEASYPDVHPDHLIVRYNQARVQACINAIFSDALTDSLTNRTEITDVAAGVGIRSNDQTGKPSAFWCKATLTTTDPMNDSAAVAALHQYIDVDAATLAIEREMTTLAYGRAQYCEAVADIHPISKAWHDMKRDNPDRFYEIATEAYKHYGKKLWMGAWSEAHSEVENFLHWVMKNHPNIDLFTQEIGMNPDPAALPAAPTATNEPTANTNNQTTTPTPMAKTANTTIPQGYKVAPAAENATPEQIAEQFKSQFEKALSAVSPSGAKLADCELVWSATTRTNDLPGRIITCKVVENEQTWHTFTFDCKDRHRDSTTYDEGMKFDWLSVDAMIKAFTGHASVLDCVKDGCKKRLTGQTAAPKAQTKTAADPQPQTAAPATVPEGSPEGQTPAIPKAQTKTAPMAQPQSNEEGAKSNVATTQTPQTPSVFRTYECSQTPAFYYHLYGEGENSGIVVIHRETGDIRQHCANQTMESSRALIKQHGMTEVQPIPTVVITALIKEGVIKAPLSINNDQAAEKAAAEKAAAEQREREEREAAERAEQERKAAEERKRKEAEAKAKREAEERAKREAAEKAKREEEERKRKEAEEEAKRKEAEAKAAAEKAEQERIEREKREAEERAEQERIEQEKAAAKAKAATIAPRHEKFDEVLWHVENDIPVYLHGPAGTGKNVMCKQIAEQLGLEFSFANAVQNSFDILGYGNAQGEYVATEFYHAFTEGKLFMLDEMDASIPEVLVILNAAIANRYCVFPVVGKVDAHPNFRIVAAGNTIGTGADQNYTGRAAIDAASLNRFAKIALDYSHAIEMGITHQNGELVEFMEALREAVRNARFDVVISYRQTIHLMKMIESGKFELAHCIRRTCLPTQNLDDIRILAENIMTSGHNKYTAALKQLCEKMRRDNKYAA